jgi:tripartite-type tricarboxylate transporter receptor subunit TctC
MRQPTPRIGTFLAEAVLSVSMIAGVVAVQARDAVESFPSRPVRIVVQSGPGGPPDIRARQIAAKLEALWGQPVIIENRPGASGLLALDFVVKAPPDGHTLLYAGQGLFVVAPHLRKLPLDPLKDFVPITQSSVSPLILMVSPAVPVRNVAELVAYAKSHPGKLNASHPGPGTTNHLAFLLLEKFTGIKTMQVPYKDGAGQAIVDLTTGRTDVAFEVFTSHGAYLKDGRLRPLAITGRERLSVLPDVPTLAEADVNGLDSIFIWGGFFVRSGTSGEVIDKLHRAITGVLQLPDVHAAVLESGARPIGNTPEEFARVLSAEYVRYGRLIGEAGIKLE